MNQTLYFLTFVYSRLRRFWAKSALNHGDKIPIGDALEITEIRAMPNELCEIVAGTCHAESKVSQLFSGQGEQIGGFAVWSLHEFENCFG